MIGFEFMDPATATASLTMLDSWSLRVDNRRFAVLKLSSSSDVLRWSLACSLLRSSGFRQMAFLRVNLAGIIVWVLFLSYLWGNECLSEYNKNVPTE
jgi:hypothetical protein